MYTVSSFINPLWTNSIKVVTFLLLLDTVLRFYVIYLKLIVLMVNGLSITTCKHLYTECYLL